MRLNRNSSIVRYWRHAAWWKGDAERAKILAKGADPFTLVRLSATWAVMLVMYWVFMVIVAFPLICAAAFVLGVLLLFGDAIITLRSLNFRRLARVWARAK